MNLEFQNFSNDRLVGIMKPKGWWKIFILEHPARIIERHEKIWNQSHVCHLPQGSETHSLTPLLKQLFLENVAISPCFPAEKNYFVFLLRFKFTFNHSPKSQDPTLYLLVFFSKKGACYFCKTRVLWLNKSTGSAYPRNNMWPSRIIKLKLFFSERARDLVWKCPGSQTVR